MSFKKKTWINIPDPNKLPNIPEGQDELAIFDADNMNRIESGIQESIDGSVRKEGGTMTGDLILNRDPDQNMQATTMQYVDNNILHFSGSAYLVEDTNNSGDTYVYLPENINTSKYTVFISAGSLGNLGNVIRYLPWNGSTKIYREDFSNQIWVNLYKESRMLVFSLDVSGNGSNTIDFDLFLVPTAECIKLTSESS